MNLYLFNWPDAVGGAGTKVWHLLRLLHRDFAITVVPNEASKCGDAVWGPALAELGVTAVEDNGHVRVVA